MLCGLTTEREPGSPRSARASPDWEPLTATAATLCCVGPAVVAVVGVGGAIAAASLKPYRSLLILVSVALLGLGFWLTYRPRAADGSAGVACPTRAGRLSRRIVWIAAAFWLAGVLLPFLVPFLS